MNWYRQGSGWVWLQKHSQNRLERVLARYERTILTSNKCVKAPLKAPLNSSIAERMHCDRGGTGPDPYAAVGNRESEIWSQDRRKNGRYGDGTAGERGQGTGGSRQGDTETRRRGATAGRKKDWGLRTGD